MVYDQHKSPGCPEAGGSPDLSKSVVPLGSDSVKTPEALDGVACDAYRKIPRVEYSSAILEPLRGFIESPLSVLTWAKEMYGDSLFFRSLTGVNYFVTSDPELISEVLGATDKANHDCFDKSSLLREGAGWIIGDDNIIVTSNEEWKAQRKLVSSYFGRSKFEMAEVLEELNTAIQEGLDSLRARIVEAKPDREVVDLQAEMSLLALRVTMRSIFKLSKIPEKKLDQVLHAARIIHSMFPFETLYPGDFPFEWAGMFSHKAREVAESKQVILEFTRDIIEQSKDFKSLQKDSVVSHMLENNISESLILHNVITMLFAGHETTGNALGWTTALLARDPKLRDRVMAEIGALDLEHTLGLNALENQLQVTNACLEESLRMYPPVYMLNRVATKDVELESNSGRIFIPKGTEVVLDIFSAQRNENYYGEQKTGYPADRFCIDRFLKDNLEERGLSLKDLNLLCFGGGPRVCLGAHLFKCEALLVLSAYLREFDFVPLFTDIEGGLVSDFSLQHRDGLKVVVSQRSLA